MPSNQLFKSWSFVSYGTLSINNYTGATIYYSMLLVVVAIEIENKSMDRMVSYTFFMNMDEALSMRHGLQVDVITVVASVGPVIARCSVW